MSVGDKIKYSYTIPYVNKYDFSNTLYLDAVFKFARRSISNGTFIDGIPFWGIHTKFIYTLFDYFVQLKCNLDNLKAKTNPNTNGIDPFKFPTTEISRKHFVYIYRNYQC